MLALAINPVNPNELYASLLNYNAVQDKASIYKSVDGGANWTLSKDALPGSSARALAYENDGSIIYAGLSGRTDNPGGVLRSIDGGLHWNSMSVGLSISSVLAIETRPRPAGSAGRLLIGTESGVWDYSVAADGDADGAPDAVENDNAGGDGNDDSIPDSIQSDVATLARTVASSGTSTDSTGPLSGVVTISIVPSPDGCSQLNDATVVEADQLPSDSGNGNSSSASLGLVRFALPECEFATVRVRYHGADFSGDHVWHNYGPRTPGDPASEAWYTFAGASLIDGETWELIIDAGAQGNIRPDPRNILFMGGPASDRIFAHGFE